MTASAIQVNIPTEMKDRRQWVNWRYEIREGETDPTKVLYRPAFTTDRAKANDPATWGSFEEAVEGRDRNPTFIDGIGFVFSDDDPFVGFDLDDCLEPDGTPKPWAQSILSRLMPTYSEVSPSGTGVKLWVRGTLDGKLPPDGTGRRKNGLGDGSGIIEIYQTRRFFTVTGKLAPGGVLEVADRQAGIDSIFTELFPPAAPGSGLTGSPRGLGLEDARILELARNASNGAGTRFTKLYDFGDLSDHHGGHSEADYSLCKSLAFWTGNDPGQIDRMFRASALYRDKWERRDYRENTIAKAIERTPDPYSPKGTLRPPVMTVPTSELEDKLLAVANVAELYRDRELLTAIAGVRVSDPAGYAGLMGVIRGLEGWRSREWEPAVKALAPRRERVAASEGDPNHTDTGNAKRLAAWYGDEIRYVIPRKTWFSWDGTRWKNTGEGVVVEYAKAVAARIHREGLAAGNEDAAAWGLESESAHRIKAMVRLAESDPTLAVEPGVFDCDPWALNVANGTIDLRTGAIRPHNRGDMLTKLAPVDYIPDAVSLPWAECLETVTAGDPELMTYLRRMTGYTVTGLTKEQGFFFLYGEGQNGKSTFMDTIHKMLGPDYTAVIDPQTISVRRGEAHTSELSDLDGKRYVFTAEMTDSGQLAENTLKRLTGSDMIRARNLYERPYYFTPTHKIWFAANDKPVIKGTDKGIWRRVRLIPFTNNIPDSEVDTSIPGRILEDLSGVLAWAVRGCLEWQRMGLAPPSKIVEATAAYRAEMDLVGNFLADEVDVVAEDPAIPEKDRKKVLFKTLYERYEAWCHSTHSAQYSFRKFAQELDRKGHKAWVSNGTRYRLGLTLRVGGVFTTDVTARLSSFSGNIVG